MNKKKISPFFKVFVSIALLLILFYKVGFSELYQLILQMDVVFLPLVILFFILNFICGFFKIKILLKPLNKKIRFLKIVKYSTIAWSFGLFSPSKIGEFSMSFFLKKEGFSLGEGFAIQIFDKGIMAFSFATIAVFSALTFFNAHNASLFLILLFLTLTVCSFVILSKFTRDIIKKYILRKYSLKFKGFSKTLFSYLRDSKSCLFLAFILSLAKIFFMALVIYYLFLSFGITVPLVYIIMIMAITIASSVIPISLNGIGVRQSIGVFLYSQIGTNPLIAMGNYTIRLALNYITGTLFISYYIWKKKKK